MGEWKQVRLGDVCEIVSGSTPKTNVEKYWNGGIKWITPAEINETDYFIYDTERHISYEAGMKPMPAGTVLLSSRAPIGKVAIAAVDMCCNQGFKNLICSDKIDNRYLFRFLKSQTVYLNSLGRGATFKEISKSIVENVTIPLPSIDIQRKIADALDKASALIEKRRLQIDKLDLLVKAQFVEMFGNPVTNPKAWESHRLADISSSRLGKMLDAKQQTGNYRFPYLANFNVQWFRFDFSDLNEMDFSDADRQEFELRKGDLLVCEGGEVGRCAIWNGEMSNCYFQKALHRVRCNTDEILPEYLSRWFQFRSQHNKFEDVVGKATIAHLPGVKLKNLSIMLPPISLQTQFADFLHHAEHQKSLLNQSLEKLERNYRSLMQKCFRGEIFS